MCQDIQGMLQKELKIELFLKNDNILIFCVIEHFSQIIETIFNFNNQQVASMFNKESNLCTN